jgi:hypothetical protein
MVGQHRYVRDRVAAVYPTGDHRYSPAPPARSGSSRFRTGGGRRPLDGMGRRERGRHAGDGLGVSGQRIAKQTGLLVSREPPKGRHGDGEVESGVEETAGCRLGGQAQQTTQRASANPAIHKDPTGYQKIGRPQRPHKRRWFRRHVSWTGMLIRVRFCKAEKDSWNFLAAVGGPWSRVFRFFSARAQNRQQRRVRERRGRPRSLVASAFFAPASFYPVPRRMTISDAES